MQPVERGVFWHRQLAFLNADRGCARCCIEGVNFDNISIRFVWRSRKRAGADNFFIKLAFDSMGHLRGGHVKATVVALAASGLSGSLITNVVTTGPVTIPLMKRVRFTRERAGAL